MRLLFDTMDAGGDRMVFGLVGLVLVFLLGTILSVSGKIIKKLLISGVIGLLLLIAINLVGRPFGISIPIRPLSAFIAGFLGWPGVVVILLFRYLL